jgi:hypothetical protein
MSDAYRSYNPIGNRNLLFNNKDFIKTLITTIREKLGRQLTRMEKAFIIQVLQQTDSKIFIYEPEIIVEKLVNHIVKQISENQCYEEPTDVHELLKTEIGVNTEDIRVESDTDFTQQITNNFASSVDVASIFGSKTFNDLKNIFAPAASTRTAYVLLDTRYRILDNDGRTLIKWNFVNSTTTTQGSVNFLGDIQNITSVRVSPFSIPYVAQADNAYKRITMYIQEFSAQSVIAQESRQYHFMFQTSVRDRYIDLGLPRDVDGIYRFRNPISRIDSLNISFGSPLQVISFDLDRRNMLLTSYTPLIKFQSTDPHNLETGDLVYITFFTTANPFGPTDTNIISAVNNLNGVIVTYVSDTEITIDVDAAALYVASPPGTVSVTNTSLIVNGAGTTFLTTFVVGDIISIAGVKYTIASIASDTSLNINIGYLGTTSAGVAYAKDNRISGMNPSFYFGSKRIQIPLEFEYIYS